MSAGTDAPDDRPFERAGNDGATIVFHPQHGHAVLATHSRPALRVHAPATVDHAVLLVGEADDAKGGRSLADDRTAFLHAVETRGWAVAEQTESEILAVVASRIIKWERHTEFVALTSYLMDDPSSHDHRRLDSDFEGLLADLTCGEACGAEVFVRMRIRVEQEGEPGQADATTDSELDPSVSQDPFPGAQESLELADPTPHDLKPREPTLIKVLANGGAISVATHLRHDAEGVMHYRATLSRQMGDQLPPERIGRFVQRLIEIETYRLLAYLAVPQMQAMGARVSALESQVNLIAARTAAQPKPDQEAAILSELTSLSAELQSIGSSTEFRFAASLAYSAIVDERLTELRENRIEAHQRLSDAVKRRLDPAMRSCEALLARQQKIAERIGNITELLRTRVDLTLQDQNTAVLRSIDARADAQLRLQQTVEGLSVAAITYYLLGIIGYLVKGAPLEQVGLSKPGVQALLVVPVALLVYFGLKKARKKAERSDPGKPGKKGSSDAA
jgi:uncharacterized membrane-anchored protein